MYIQNFFELIIPKLLVLHPIWYTLKKIESGERAWILGTSSIHPISYLLLDCSLPRICFRIKYRPRCWIKAPNNYLLFVLISKYWIPMYLFNLLHSVIFYGNKWYLVTKIVLWEKNVLVIEKMFEIRGWRPRICKILGVTRTIYSNSERSEQFLLTECFFNLFLEVSHI